MAKKIRGNKIRSDEKKILGAKKKEQRTKARQVAASHKGKIVDNLKPTEQLALLKAVLLQLGICDIDGVIQ
ncbi:MAG: hypothetical protein HN390_01420 [Anaerolineae bacterium]|nr:hypothetical protein [Anaerolineae bacterium]MBT7192112.1 hypothetical protein [Anaerolineae bacterium]